jgi:hypothetical protein
MGHGLQPGPADDLGDPIRVDEGTLARTQAPRPSPIGLAARDGAARATPPTIADRVIGFAKRNLGDRVGDGECFALVDRALRRAGAKTARDYGAVTPDADYVWGAAIARADLQPGDIVQFRDYSSEVVITRPGETSTETQSRPHHTAIVERIASDGGVTVLEQNIPRGGAVRRTQLRFASGTTSAGETTTTVTVSGQLWFYRPEPR